MSDVADPRVTIQTSLQQASNYNAWIVDQARQYLGRRVMDAGCGSGNLARLMLDRELILAVDEWPDFVSTVSASFADVPNLITHRADLSDPSLPEQLRHHDIDSVICSNVLEHVEDDAQALTNFAEIVGAGGRVFLLVPAFMILFGEHDRADHHFRRYTKGSLRDTVAPLPLVIEQDYYMNMPGFFAWFLYVRLLGRRLSEEGVGLYDRVIPAIRAVESQRRPPFGQTLVAVLRSTVRAG